MTVVAEISVTNITLYAYDTMLSTSQAPCHTYEVQIVFIAIL